MSTPYLLPDTLSQILEILPYIGWIIISLIRILTRGSQQFLMCSFERIDTDFQLDVVVGQFGAGFGVAGLFFEPLLAARGEGGHCARHRRAESFDFVLCYTTG